MRRAGTGLVFAAILGIAIAAGVDALQERADDRSATTKGRTPVSGGAPDRPDESLVEDRAELVRELRREAIEGFIVYTDANCELRTLFLHDLESVAGPDRAALSGCRFSLSPVATHLRPLGNTWRPDGRLVARCRGNTVQVAAAGRGPLYTLRGSCAPAWKPNGTLTVAGAGGIIGHRLPCSKGKSRCETTILARDDLLRTFRSYSGARSADRVGIEDMAWLSNVRLAMVARLGWPDGRTSADIVAVFERRRLIRPPSVFGRFTRLRASPKGSFIALLVEREPEEIWLLDRDGTLVTAQFPSVGSHAIAWSADERWTAVATRASIFLIKTSEISLLAGAGAQPRTIRLPIVAGDLAWR